MPPVHRLSPDEEGQIWLDVTDLLWWENSVTGIQRVMASVAAELLGRQKRNRSIRFCRYAQGTGFIEVRHEKIRLHIRKLLGAATPVDLETEDGPPSRLGFAKEQVWSAIRSVYPPISRTLEPRSYESGPIARLRRAGRGVELWLLRKALRPNKMFRSNDLLLNIGSSWWQPDHAKTLKAIKLKSNLRYAVLVYDVIPWRLPQRFPKRMVRQFLNWAKATVCLSDGILTISQCSRDDLRAFSERFGLPVRPIEVIRLGGRLPARQDGILPPALQNSPAGFVLCVATVEARKNHVVLARTWEELLKRYDHRLIPNLVWVGRKGWMVDSLMRELKRTNCLEGKLLWLGKEEGVSEDALHALYRACLFTMFPSLYEGWGLPVSESLAHGKLCIASNSSSIPEAGRDLVDYHGPEDIAKCIQLTERAILDPSYRVAREARIRREFSMPSWPECAEDIIRACEDLSEPKKKNSSHSARC